MSDCLFCKIITGDIPANKVYEDADCLAFRDIHPKAPTHVLVIPKKHITSLAHAHTEDAQLLGILLDRVRQIAESEGIAQSGYRVIINSGDDGRQEVPHLHLHLIGGKKLGV
ncbi:MAG: histidine triad nucleotide-binding protein [Mariprofundaceae bacterium]|nr:histidine triad nucleotide-binding protein [Mariprofundaceae bacterium]